MQLVTNITKYLEDLSTLIHVTLAKYLENLSIFIHVTLSQPFLIIGKVFHWMFYNFFNHSLFKGYWDCFWYFTVTDNWNDLSYTCFLCTQLNIFDRFIEIKLAKSYVYLITPKNLCKFFTSHPYNNQHWILITFKHFCHFGESIQYFLNLYLFLY